MSKPEPALTELRFFLDRALDGMLAILSELGDERANEKADLPGANSAFAIVTHCLGVLEYWVGWLIAGRPVQRVRVAEFSATGRVFELAARAAAVRAALDTDLAVVQRLDAPLARRPGTSAQGPDRYLTVGGVLLHVLEELAQHHGQLQVLRDSVNQRPTPADWFEPELAALRSRRGVKWARPGAGRLAAWVADMDFAVCPPVEQAITAAVRRGDLGYPNWPVTHGRRTAPAGPDGLHPLANAFADRMRTRFGWAAEPSHVRGVSDLLQALQQLLALHADPGGVVAAQLPNYPPFLATLASMGWQLLPVPVAPLGSEPGIDPDRLDRELAATGARMLLLVNPHNPTGRVFSRAELETLAEIAVRRDLLVVCDEIHADLIYPGHQHVPFASLGDEVAQRTVTISSATKAFNIAGLRTAVAHIGPTWLRAAWDDRPPDLLGPQNVLGMEATLAAWSQGDEWLAALVRHLTGQRDHLARRVAADLPGVSLRPPQGTYLAWLDCRQARLPSEPAEFFRVHAGVELSPGLDFGDGGRGHARLNFATSRAILDQILDRMAEALMRVGPRTG